jgi:hypothetical protein
LVGAGATAGATIRPAVEMVQEHASEGFGQPGEEFDRFGDFLLG